MAVLLSLGLGLLWPGLASASVTLSDFRTASAGDHITVLWETGTELNNLGFYIWRAQSDVLADANRITDTLIPSQAGGQATGASYSYEDFGTVEGTTYYYWLEAVDTNDARQFDGPVQGAFGGQTALATPTTGSGQGGLPTSTPAPTNTPAPSITPAPTGTPRPTTVATDVATAAATTAATTGTNQTPDATAEQPAPTTNAEMPAATETPGPPPQPSPTLTFPSEIASTAADGNDREEQAAESDEQPEDDLAEPQVIGSNSALPTPSAAPLAAESADPAANTLSPLVIAGLIAGVLVAVTGGIALSRLLRRPGN